MNSICSGLYFSLDELRALSRALADSRVATTQRLATECSWQLQAAWNYLKKMEDCDYIEKLEKPPYKDGTATVEWQLSAGDALHAKISSMESIVSENEHLDARYIRCGGWCKCLRSQIGKGPDFEFGISAYNALKVNTCWQPKDRAFWRKNISRASGPSTWYLVTGETIGVGSDGEALLKLPRAISTLVWEVEACVFRELSTVTPDHPESNHPSCGCVANQR